MAYIDFNMPASGPGGVAASASVVGTLDQLEWEVVRLARGDRLASLRAPGRWARLRARLFGADINPRLADPRLEALRGLAVLAWHHGYALPVSAIKAFKAAGFSMDQFEAVQARIAAIRGREIGRHVV